MNDNLSQSDRDTLRSLAGRIAAIAHSDLMIRRRRDWANLNGLRGDRPMIIVEHSGVVNEVGHLFAPTCTDPWARGIESVFRQKLYEFEQVGDDIVIEPVLSLGAGVTTTDYGVKSVKHGGEGGPAKGSYVWEAALPEFPKGLDRLKFREFSFDRAAADREQERAEAIVGDLVKVQQRPWLWWTHGLTIVAVDLIGLEGLMMAMYDQPEGLHRLMAFLRDDHLNALAWHEQNGLLFVNNRDEYCGSGGCGYTDDLPAPGYVPGEPARLKDMWGLSESQETVGVSPEMFAEFIFPYQLPVISRFGLSYYGCCEPVDTRWHVIKQIPNLRAVSVSPWANVEQMAANLGKNYVFCRKPNPAYVSAQWDEDVIRQDLRHTIEVTKGLNVQLILKDVHTVSNEPWRLARWVAIAREEIARVYDR